MNKETQDLLVRHGEMVAGQQALELTSHSGIVKLPSGRYLRYSPAPLMIEPIRRSALCKDGEGYYDQHQLLVTLEGWRQVTITGADAYYLEDWLEYVRDDNDLGIGEYHECVEDAERKDKADQLERVLKPEEMEDFPDPPF